jgi:hypothetical protein
MYTMFIILVRYPFISCTFPVLIINFRKATILCVVTIEIMEIPKPEMIDDSVLIEVHAANYVSLYHGF